MQERDQPQGAELVFALDIGTRSVIGVAGTVEDGRFRVLAMEREEHEKRAMLDGQIEDIAQVAKAARRVAGRLEEKVGCRLTRVCVAAAGRALCTRRAGFALEFSEPRRVDAELVGQLEAGAVSAAEEALAAEQTGGEAMYLVGYTVAQYRLDAYPLSTLLGHRGKKLEADVVATFLPGEVVESLYAVTSQAGLEVASLTLEPIAALNAAIPAELRLLNLVLADIGAGTSDIAVCRDGSVVGYTMATVAGDEITEGLMRSFLVDFQTAERLKAELGGEAPVSYRDILGAEHQLPPPELAEAVRPSARLLAQEIAGRILDLNGAPPSAVFLAGGGSKLAGLRELVAEQLGMDPGRVAVAGNNFAKSAFSEVCDLDDPAYATPLGIAVSAGLGLVNDSYVITLNGQPAKLFRSGTLTLRDILLMNGYTYSDMIGATGRRIAVTLDGRRVTLRGAPATPPVLRLNGQDAPLSAVVGAGDAVDFRPAEAGPAESHPVRELLAPGFAGTVRINGEERPWDTLLRDGDTVETAAAPAPEAPPAAPPEAPAAAGAEVVPAPRPCRITLNGRPLSLPPKADGAPHYLMDLLERSGIDLDHVQSPVLLRVNGEEGAFTRELREGDTVVIRPQS